MERPRGTRRSIVLPASLHDQVTALAERERRSFNNMVAVLIEEALAARQQVEERSE